MMHLVNADVCYRSVVGWPAENFVNRHRGSTTCHLYRQYFVESNNLLCDVKRWLSPQSRLGAECYDFTPTTPISTALFPKSDFVFLKKANNWVFIHETLNQNTNQWSIYNLCLPKFIRLTSWSYNFVLVSASEASGSLNLFCLIYYTTLGSRRDLCLSDFGTHPFSTPLRITTIVSIVPKRDYGVTHPVRSLPGPSKSNGAFRIYHA